MRRLVQLYGFAMTAALAFGAAGCDDDDNDNDNDALLADGGSEDSGQIDASRDGSTTDSGKADAEADGSTTDTDGSTTDAEVDGSRTDTDGSTTDAEVDGSTTDTDGSTTDVDAELNPDAEMDGSTTDAEIDGSVETKMPVGGKCKCDDDCATFDGYTSSCFYGICALEINGISECEEEGAPTGCPGDDEKYQCWGVGSDTSGYKPMCFISADDEDCDGVDDASSDHTCWFSTETKAYCDKDCATYCTSGGQQTELTTITADSCAAYYDCTYRAYVGDYYCSGCDEYYDDEDFTYYVGREFATAEECKEYLCVSCESGNANAFQTFEDLMSCSETEECEYLEQCDACSDKIAACFVTGDNICSPTETAATEIACAKCGDGICTPAANETAENCYIDCAESVSNKTCGEAIDISAGGEFKTSNIGSGNDYVGKSGNDVFFKFTLAESKNVTLTTSAAESDYELTDTYLWLLKGTCTDLAEIAHNDDIDYSGGNAYSEIKAVLPAGDYYVVAESYYSDTYGDFKLTAAFDAYTAECGDGYCTDESDDPTASNYCAEDCVKCGDKVCSPEETLDNCPADCVRADDGICTAGYESILTSAADCGGACGDFICSVDEKESCDDDCDVPANDTCANAIPLTLGTPVQGGITTASAGLYGDPDVWYQFTVTEAGTYAIDIEETAGNWQPYFDVLPSCSSTSSQRLTGSRTHAAMEFAAGTYYIAVTRYDSASLGAFSLKVSPYTYTVPTLTDTTAVLTDAGLLGLKLKGADEGKDVLGATFSLLNADGEKLLLGYDVDYYTGEITEYYDMSMYVSAAYEGNNYVATTVFDTRYGQNIDTAVKATVTIFDADSQKSEAKTVDLTSSVTPEEVAVGEVCDEFFTVCATGNTCNLNAAQTAYVCTTCAERCDATTQTGCTSAYVCTACGGTDTTAANGTYAAENCSFSSTPEACPAGKYGEPGSCADCKKAADLYCATNAFIDCTGGTTDNAHCTACDEGLKLASGACNACDDADKTSKATCEACGGTWDEAADAEVACTLTLPG